jgi:2'-5' RNA ligase
MKRTFIAIKIEPEDKMKSCISHLREVLRREKITWIDPGKLHITLKFLGDTDENQVKSTTRVLEETVPGFPASEMVFRGLGVFRNLRDPRVLWIGTEAGQTLGELKNEIDDKLLSLGFPKEKRKHRFHLTLGRIKFIRDTELLQDLLAEYRQTLFQKNLISEVIYYESFLRPEGARHVPIRKFSMG